MITHEPMTPQQLAITDKIIERAKQQAQEKLAYQIKQYNEDPELREFVNDIRPLLELLILQEEAEMRGSMVGDSEEYEMIEVQGLGMPRTKTVRRKNHGTD